MPSIRIIKENNHTACEKNSSIQNTVGYYWKRTKYGILNSTFIWFITIFFSKQAYTFLLPWKYEVQWINLPYKHSPSMVKCWLLLVSPQGLDFLRLGPHKFISPLVLTCNFYTCHQVVSWVTTIRVSRLGLYPQV